ncbi:BTB domain-containing protein [Favolaschia claudopus]|uniref:BTB domain-containing protein n=1 Tax=Favolaschia claudopus TaxID=2862362 RepID=A0AAW0A417_9AGAR
MDRATRDSDFYIEDGNIVLVADSEKDQCAVLFRLHKSILMKHSTVFADMFSMPSPPNVEKYDNVPLVKMAGDDADALRDFMKLLYNPECISTVLNANDFPMKLLGPCKMARKYQVDWIRNMAVERLQKSWPSTVLGWQEFAEEENAQVMRAIQGYPDPRWDDPTSPPRVLPEPVSSILLARECDVTTVLPLAFLDLLQRLPEPDPMDQYDEYYKKADLDLLPADDWRRLFRARERMAAWFRYYPSSPPSDLRPCLSGKSCEAIVYRIWLKFGNQLGVCGDILRISLQEHEMENMCAACKSRLEAEVGTLQGEFLRELPNFFC